MRTTLTIEDRLARALKAKAHETGRSFKEVVNETIARGLAGEPGGPVPRPYRLEPVSLGSPRAGVDLDRALALADALEDAEIARDLEARK